MSQSVRYSCTVLRGGKKGTIPVDQNGYRLVNVGAFNVYNHSGEYYPMLDAIDKMFRPGGAARRRLDRGLFKGEYFHPKPQPGWKLAQWIKRVITVEEQFVSQHFADLLLTETRDEHNQRIVLAQGRLKPAGPYGDTLENSLSNPEENVAFSLRALSNKVRRPDGGIEKHVNTIVTWDHVTEPGISVSNKYESPTLESLGPDLTVTQDMLRDLAHETVDGVALESARTAKMILTELGWNKVEVVSPDHRFLNW